MFLQWECLLPDVKDELEETKHVMCGMAFRLINCISKDVVLQCTGAPGS